MQQLHWVSLRNLGWLEGASLVLLLFVAMPLKYMADLPQMVRVVGMAHGLLFLAFVAWVCVAAFQHRWPVKKIGLALGSSLVPFAPFFVDLDVEGH